MFNVNEIIQSGGIWLIGLFLFSEVGLFLGFFLPGDTLLIAGGIYAMQGKLNLISVIVVALIAAILGDSTAYLIGRKIGRRLFTKKDSVLFDAKHVKRAEDFYQKYGSKAVLIAHFIPVIRTFNPLVGGVAEMPYSKFLLYDAIGDSAWAIIVTLIGYYIGSRIPHIDHYILGVVGLVVVVSLAPTLYHFVIKRYLLKSRRAKKELEP